MEAIYDEDDILSNSSSLEFLTSIEETSPFSPYSQRKEDVEQQRQYPF